MKVSELNDLSIKELEEKLENEQTFIVKQRINHAVSPLDNPLKMRETRKNIARIKTVLRQKQLSENKQ